MSRGQLSLSSIGLAPASGRTRLLRQAGQGSVWVSSRSRAPLPSVQGPVALSRLWDVPRQTCRWALCTLLAAQENVWHGDMVAAVEQAGPAHVLPLQNPSNLGQARPCSPLLPQPPGAPPGGAAAVQVHGPKLSQLLQGLWASGPVPPGPGRVVAQAVASCVSLLPKPIDHDQHHGRRGEGQHHHEHCDVHILVPEGG